MSSGDDLRFSGLSSASSPSITIRRAIPSVMQVLLTPVFAHEDRASSSYAAKGFEQHVANPLLTEADNRIEFATRGPLFKIDGIFACGHRTKLLGSSVNRPSPLRKASVGWPDQFLFSVALLCFEDKFGGLSSPPMKTQQQVFDRKLRLTVLRKI